MSLQFNLAVHIHGVGTLALVGVTPEPWPSQPPLKETVVQFILEYDQYNAPLLGRMWIGDDAKHYELLNTLRSIDPIMLATDADRRLLFFSRTANGQLKHHMKFLYGTVNKLRRELWLLAQNTGCADEVRQLIAVS